MGKHSRKNKKVGSKSTENVNLNENNLDNETIVFISMAQELKEEGNKLFQTKDYEKSILKYQKALKLLPGNHFDVSYLHSNIAACYMQMGISDFPRAIHECNLALEVTPKYSKALLKRARCYEALNRVNLAFRDVNMVLDIEPNNLMATEILDRLKARMEDKLIDNKPNDDKKTERFDRIVEKMNELKDFEKDEKKPEENLVLENKREKKGERFDRIVEKMNEFKVFEKKEKKPEDKLVLDEKISTNGGKEEDPKRVVKLVYGEDIRFAKIPLNCDIINLREIISDRFPVSKAVLIKYKDEENDMVTLTTNEELKWAESSTSGQRVVFRLHIIEVNPDQDPFFYHIRTREKKQKISKSSVCIDDWILEFAQLFKNFAGFNTDEYLNLHEVGTKLYSEAMEDTVTSNESQDFFQTAADNFQEMAALAFFIRGNVHMSKARKRVYDTENGSIKSRLLMVKDSYDFAQMEYLKAGERYQETIRIKPDFYEGFLALGQLQFEKAKLSWYYAVSTKINLEKFDSTEIFQLYNEAEENMETGMKNFENFETGRVTEVLRPNKLKLDLQKTDFCRFVKDLSQDDEKAERAANIRRWINVLWGVMLYERSMMEYRLGIPVWQECLEIAVEKFELAGASRSHIAFMKTNHCSNDSTPQGVEFSIDEIVQAWLGRVHLIPSFRIEPLLQRRVSNLSVCSSVTNCQQTILSSAIDGV